MFVIARKVNEQSFSLCLFSPRITYDIKSDFVTRPRKKSASNELDHSSVKFWLDLPFSGPYRQRGSPYFISVDPSSSSTSVLRVHGCPNFAYRRNVLLGAKNEVFSPPECLAPLAPTKVRPYSRSNIYAYVPRSKGPKFWAKDNFGVITRLPSHRAVLWNIGTT